MPASTALACLPGARLTDGNRALRPGSLFRERFMNPHRMVILLFSTLAIGAAVATVSTDSSAGAILNALPTCVLASASSDGYCIGTFPSFTNNIDPSAYATFYSTYSSSGGTWSFNAEVGGGYYSCSVPSTNPALAAIGSTVTAAHGQFYVTWNQLGQCTSARFSNASDYHSTW
jgi:hypothetical protein